MTVILFLLACLCMGCHATVSYFMTDHRFSSRTTMLIWLAFWVVTVMLVPIIESSTYANKKLLGFYFSLFLHVALYYFTSKGNVGKRTFLLLTYCIIFSMSLGIYDIIRYNYLPYPDSPTAFLTLVTILFISMSIFLHVLLPIINNTGKYIGKQWTPLCIVSALFLVALITISITPNITREVPTKDIAVYVSFAVLICAFYPIIFSHLKVVAQVSQSKQVELHRNLLLSYVDNQRMQTEFARRLHHDLRHHNFVIGEYAKAGDTDSLLRYLDQHEAQIAASAEIKICENETLNHILRVFTRQAERANIHFTMLVQARSNLSIVDVDLVALIANVLENALNGCQVSKSEAPYIHLHIHEKSGKLVIRCENSCLDDLNFTGEMPVHYAGTGVASMTDVAERYDGSIDFSARDGRFTCGILLNCRRLHEKYTTTSKFPTPPIINLPQRQST